MLSLLSTLSEPFLAKSIVIRNLDDEVAFKIRLRAARHGRSMEAEVREILRATAAAEPGSDFWERAAKLRAETRGRVQTLSETLLRQGRDEP
jgi:plasmid stability protein